MSKPLRALQTDIRAKAMPEIQQAQQRREIAEKYVEHLSSQAVKEKDEAEREQRTAEAARLASELPSVPSLPTLIVCDRTPERLEVDLAEQGGALLIEDEEAGTLFAIAGGRYSRDGSAPLDLYCKAYDRGSLDTNRITRARVSVDTPELSINVTPQPVLMRKLRERPEYHERGLLPRFLFARPVSNVGYRPYDQHAAFDATVAKNYADMIAQLATVTRWPDGTELPHLRIEGEALLVWKRYADRVDRDCREGGRLHSIREWASKHPGRVARIAGALHGVTLVETKRLQALDPLPQNKDQMDLEDAEHLAARSISPRTVAAACRLGKYYEAHALATYDCMAALPDIEGARRVLAWLRRTKRKRFSAREAFTALDRHFFRTMDDLLPCLGRLVDYGYIRWVPPLPRSGAGRPPSPVYEVNPKVFEPLGKVRTPPPPPGNSADTAEESNGFPGHPKNASGDFADIAEGVAPFRESKGADPGNGTADFADTAEGFGGVHWRPTAAEAASEKPRDAPQYTQNPGGDVQPPTTHDRGNATEGGRVNAQALDGDALQAPQYPHNSVVEGGEAFTPAEGSNASTQVGASLPASSSSHRSDGPPRQQSRSRARSPGYLRSRAGSRRRRRGDCSAASPASSSYAASSTTSPVLLRPSRAWMWSSTRQPTSARAIAAARTARSSSASTSRERGGSSRPPIRAARGASCTRAASVRS
jgi:replicative DNA helicase